MDTSNDYRTSPENGSISDDSESFLLMVIVLWKKVQVKSFDRQNCMRKLNWFLNWYQYTLMLVGEEICMLLMCELRVLVEIFGNNVTDVSCLCYIG